MTVAKILTVVIILSSLLANCPAIGADRCCHSCGCRKVKKVTRLVKTTQEIKIPHYRCSTSESFYPEKGTVCRSGYRCDTYYTPHACWHCKEHCVEKESCEHVVHYVNQGHGNGCERSDEHHHKKHVEYEIESTCHGCISCKTDCGCKTLHGARLSGCFRETCIQQPTGIQCRHLVPVVRWVTMVMCTQCAHCWPNDEVAIEELIRETSDPAPQGVVELARPSGHKVSTKFGPQLRQPH